MFLRNTVLTRVTRRNITENSILQIIFPSTSASRILVTPNIVRVIVFTVHCQTECLLESIVVNECSRFLDLLSDEERYLSGRGNMCRYKSSPNFLTKNCLGLHGRIASQASNQQQGSRK
jgi:hypothetical protein